ncbi:MAG: hypothetical protein U0790_06470 [Isosphaeraceae bacterium]
MTKLGTGLMKLSGTAANTYDGITEVDDGRCSWRGRRGPWPCRGT